LGGETSVLLDEREPHTKKLIGSEKARKGAKHNKGIVSTSSLSLFFFSLDDQTRKDGRIVAARAEGTRQQRTNQSAERTQKRQA